MKKKYLIILSVILIILITLLIYSKKDYKEEGNPVISEEEVVMSIQEDSLSSSGAIIIVKSLNDREYTTGNSYKLMKYDDNKWQEMDMKEDMITTSNALILPYQETIDWTEYYGKLDKGKYRLVKEIMKENDDTIYDIYVEFEI